MKKQIHIVALLLMGVLTAFTDEGPLIRKQFIECFSQQTASDAAIEQQMKAMRPDGTWPDVDYASTRRGNWPTLNHLKRVVTLATAYSSPESALYQDPELKTVILRALNQWIEKDYQNSNWWQWRIGIPENMLTAFVLLDDDLPATMLKDAQPILDRSKMGQTGQNKVWCAGIAFMKGLLHDNSDLMAEASNAIWEELRVTTEEGIQPDWSFHQHGAQQQFGNYGMSFAGDMIKWGTILHGTDYALSGERLEVLRNYLLEGVSWIIWNGRMDFSGCGRQIDQGCQKQKGRNTTRQLKALQDIDPGFPAQYGAALKRIGFKPFWRSEMAVQRRPDWYASVKMSSKRVIGAETCNSENMQGVHLGDGTLLVCRDGSEYEDIVPVWDWKRLPGTTCDQGIEKLAPEEADQGYGVSEFSGVLGDGETGMAAMIYKRGNLSARKSYFFLNDHMVCLGAGIRGETIGDVYTSVQQSWLKGDVKQGGNWVYHDGVGYQFLDGKPRIESGEVSGNWNTSFPTRGDRPTEGDVFSLWIDHGKSPTAGTYAYKVVPQISADDREGFQALEELTVLANSEAVQAITFGWTTYAAFYEAGKFNIGKKRVVESDGPCLFYMTNTRLMVSDPTHSLQTLEIKVNGKSVHVELPQGAERGTQVVVK